MNLVIETDLGHDPDDFFAICYLIAAGCKVRHISICAGDPDQVALADLIRSRTGQDFTIGVSHVDRMCTCGEVDCPAKLSSGGMHHKLLKKYGKPLHCVADGFGTDLLDNTLLGYNEGEVSAFVIGPPKCIGYLAQFNSSSLRSIGRATIQGGFLGYHQHDFPVVRLEKFEGKSWCPTFNLNGDRKGAVALANVGIPLRYVSKNVCHTVEFDGSRFLDFLFRSPESPAEELFLEAGKLYFEKHTSKKFHDPTAAVCHLHPEIAFWVKGYMAKLEGGWGGIPDSDGHDIIAGINYDRLWEHLVNFN